MKKRRIDLVRELWTRKYAQRIVKDKKKHMEKFKCRKGKKDVK